jgi:hypothetical protein
MSIKSFNDINDIVNITNKEVKPIDSLTLDTMYKEVPKEIPINITIIKSTIKEQNGFVYNVKNQNVDNMPIDKNICLSCIHSHWEILSLVDNSLQCSCFCLIKHSFSFMSTTAINTLMCSKYSSLANLLNNNNNEVKL